MTQPLLLILEPLGVDTAAAEAALTKATGARCVWGDVSAVDTAAVEFVVTVKTPVTAALMAELPNLKAVAVAFTGYDVVDLDACRARGVAVMNVPEYATTAVAELVIGLSIAILRDIPQASQAVAAGEWPAQTGGELAGKTVGIVGTGAIGVATAARFAAFGCTVLGWSRTERSAFTEYGSYIPELSTLLEQSDIVSLHVPLTPQTKGLIGETAFAALKPGASLINTARGPVVDENALLAALERGQLAAAALDVFATEPLPVDHPLRTHERVLATPHISFNTTPALAERLQVTSANLAAFYTGQPTNVVS